MLDYGNDYALGSFSINRGNRGTTKRVRESVGSMVIIPGDKKALGAINTTVEENE